MAAFDLDLSVQRIKQFGDDNFICHVRQCIIKKSCEIFCEQNCVFIFWCWCILQFYFVTVNMVHTVNMVLYIWLSAMIKWSFLPDLMNDHSLLCHQKNYIPLCMLSGNYFVNCKTKYYVHYIQITPPQNFINEIIKVIEACKNSINKLLPHRFCPRISLHVLG